MLSFRHLHSTKSKSAKLDLNGIIQTYNLDGIKKKVGKESLESFNLTLCNAERNVQRNDPEIPSLKKYLLFTDKDDRLPMSYASFKTRYNSYEKETPTELSECMFCSKNYRKSSSLDNHMEVCKAAKLLRKKLMLKKVKSIIQKSKLPLKIKRGVLKKSKRKPKPRELPFACIKCSDRFVSAHSLELHIKYDHRPRPTCSICQKMFDCRRKLNEHEPNCTGEDQTFIRQNLGVLDVLSTGKVHACNKCENLFINQDQLREHKLLINKRSPFPIIICSEELPKVKKQDIGFKVCVKNVPQFIIKQDKFIEGDNDCVYCGKEFQNNKRLLQHGSFCHIKNKFMHHTPVIPPKRVFKQSKPKNLQVRHNIHSRTCPICKKHFKTDETMIKHLKEAHKPTKNKSKIKKHYMKLVCNACSKEYRNFLSFYKHMQCHISALHKCPICKFKHFQTQKLLKFHIQIYHKRSYCVKCHMTYGKSKSKSHRCKTNHKKQENVFEGDTSKSEFICKPLTRFNLCNSWKHFNQKGKFLCYICTKPLSEKMDLAIHLIKQHSTTFPFKCKHCTKCFKQPDELTSHHKGYHGDRNDYVGIVSLESLLRRHSINECQFCEENLFIGEEDLVQHCMEDHEQVDNILHHMVSFNKYNNNLHISKLDIIANVNITDELPVSYFTNNKIDTNYCHRCEQRIDHTTSSCPQNVQTIKSARPSLDTILSADNTFIEAVVVEDEVMTLKEIQNSLLPLSIGNFEHTETDKSNQMVMAEANVELQDIRNKQHIDSVPRRKNSIAMTEPNVEIQDIGKKQSQQSPIIIYEDEKIINNYSDQKQTLKRKKTKKGQKFKRKRRIFVPTMTTVMTDKNTVIPVKKPVTKLVKPTVTNCESSVINSLPIFHCKKCSINFDAEKSLKIHTESFHSKKQQQNIINHPRERLVNSRNQKKERKDHTRKLQKDTVQTIKKPLFIDLTQKLFTTNQPSTKLSKSTRHRKQSNPKPLLRDSLTSPTRHPQQNHNNTVTNHSTLSLPSPSSQMEERMSKKQCKQYTSIPYNSTPSPPSPQPQLQRRVSNRHKTDSSLPYHRLTVPLQDVFASNNNNSFSPIDKNLYPTLPLPTIPVNPTYFTAPQWDRNAFDIWNVF